MHLLVGCFACLLACGACGLLAMDGVWCLVVGLVVRHGWWWFVCFAVVFWLGLVVTGFVLVLFVWCGCYVGICRCSLVSGFGSSLMFAFV